MKTVLALLGVLIVSAPVSNATTAGGVLRVKASDFGSVVFVKTSDFAKPKPTPAPEVAAPDTFRNQVQPSGIGGADLVHLGRTVVSKLTAVAGSPLPLLRDNLERIDGAAGGWSGGGSASAGYGRGYGAKARRFGSGPIRRFLARAPLRRLGARVFSRGVFQRRVTVSVYSSRSGW